MRGSLLPGEGPGKRLPIAGRTGADSPLLKKHRPFCQFFFFRDTI
jgi:hypothetical protein